MSASQPFENPIDPDKITEHPSLIPYAHHVGSAIIKPEDQGKTKGRALTAMEHQTDLQMTQIYEQMQLLAGQVKKLEDRKRISHFIYQYFSSFYFFKSVRNYKRFNPTSITNLIQSFISFYIFPYFNITWHTPLF
jgi:hypothetical protein